MPRGERTIDRWFDVSKLANPAPGQLGNAGKGVIRGSGNNKWDVIISKFLRVAAGHRLEFRAELFNAFNHPQFDDPVVTPGNNPLAGKITSASDFGFTQTERVIQLGNQVWFLNLLRMKKSANARRSAGLTACMILVVLGVCLRAEPVSTSVNTRTPHGKSAKGFLKASFGRLHRRPTGISGWAPNSACFGSMACGPSRGSHQRREHLPSSDIRSLQGARDGRLWIGTFSGLASWKDGKLTHYPELDGQIIEALLEDREGTIWVAGWAPSVGRLCRIQSGNTQCYGEDGRFGSGVTALI